MIHTHNPFRHLQYLRQALSQVDKPVGFFISAGCPLAVEMPEGEWPLIPDVRLLTERISKDLSRSEEYQKLLSEVEQSGKDKENIEHILTFIRSLKGVSHGGEVRGFNEVQLEGLNKDVCEKIVRHVSVDLPALETPYHRVAKWIRSIDRKKPVEIFTTNYDLLMESALDSLEVPYFDGFVGSRRPFFDLKALEEDLVPSHWTRLWKIHGSINWYSDSSTESRNIYRSSEVKSESTSLIHPSHLKYDESRKMPYLALMDQLTRFLRKKSSILIICGYSFSDGHINGAILNALRANPTGVAVALLYGSHMNGEKVRYEEACRLASIQHNLSVWEDDQAIIGTNSGNWHVPTDYQFDPDLIDFVSGYQDVGQLTRISVGDFLNFSSFLKRIIGGVQGGDYV